MHGGLFSRDGVTLDDIRKVDRNQEPPDQGTPTLVENVSVVYLMENSPRYHV